MIQCFLITKYVTTYYYRRNIFKNVFMKSIKYMKGFLVIILNMWFTMIVLGDATLIYVVFDSLIVGKDLFTYLCR